MDRSELSRAEVGRNLPEHQHACDVTHLNRLPVQLGHFRKQRDCLTLIPRTYGHNDDALRPFDIILSDVRRRSPCVSIHSSDATAHDAIYGDLVYIADTRAYDGAQCMR